MADFVKKTMMGYPVVRGGQSDPDCTHVILTKKEYEQILWERTLAEQEAEIAKSNAAREINEAQSRAAFEAQQTVQKAKKAIEGWRAALEAEKAESGRQRALNANLLRIAKERANADRKLKPKKEHTGYGVVFSGEKDYRYKIGRRNMITVRLWETVIQSPYTVDMPEDLARSQIKEELIRKDDAGVSLINRIGVNRYYPGSYADMVDDPQWCEELENSNIMLELNLRVNFRSGYWEAVFFHTKPLGVVPKDMRVN